MDILWFVLGLALMIAGAEVLVRGASRTAVMMGISPLVVGLTVVAFGTSAPEFAVSLKAAYAGQASICVGNVIGSNIFNILFILGLSAIIVPLVVSPQLIRFDLPLVILVSIIVFAMSLDGNIGRIDGIILFSGLLAYTVSAIYGSRKAGKAIIGSPSPESLSSPTPFSIRALAINLALMVVGLTLLVMGANWLVDTAVRFAIWMNVSELVIGLTIVSIGTSLPEVVTSIVAGLKGERDIAVGNVVGSNLFNLLGVLGLSAAVSPLGIDVSDQAIRLDMPIMVMVAIAALPVLFTRRLVSRSEGVALLLYYVVYTIFLILNVIGDPRADIVSAGVLYVALPITALVLVIRSAQWAKTSAAAS